MKRRATFAAAALVLLLGYPWKVPGAQVPPGAATPLTLDSYKAQLQKWTQELDGLQGHPEDAAKFRATLPQNSMVQEGTQTLEVSHSWLKSALLDFIAANPQRRRNLLSQMQARLAAQQEQADAYQQGAPYPPSSRQTLSNILAQSEFRRVRGPSAWETWKRRMINRIFQWLDHIFRAVPSSVRGGEILVWIVIAVVLCVVAIWLKRTAARRIEDWPREPIPFARSGKRWRQWLDEARDAAQQDRWRDAIHLAYWAAISHLEQSGAWIPDRARTPREYLRLLPAASERRPALEALTRRFETTWYGQRDAAAADFAETLAQLERLGCR